jgi:hypothetical protein
MPQRLSMSEVRRDTDLGAISFHQLIDAATAHVENWEADLNLLGELNEGIFLIEQRFWVLDQHVPRPG